MSRPKQQHYVPQIYLKQFCSVGNKKQIYFYDKQTKRTSHTNISNVAQEKDFYSDISKDDKDYFEKFYAQNVEPKLSIFLNDTISKSMLYMENIPLISIEDRKLLSRLLVYQILRTPNARILMREKADIVSPQVIDRFLNMDIVKNNDYMIKIAEKYRSLDENKFREIALPLTIDEDRLERYSVLIDSMVCLFYFNQTQLNFITSDNPVVIFDLLTKNIGLGKAGLDSSSCQISYPISPRLTAILFKRNSLYAQASLENENRMIHITQPEIIHTYNRMQFQQASRQVYSSSEYDWKTLLT